jgi:hypothetical protein
MAAKKATTKPTTPTTYCWYGWVGNSMYGFEDSPGYDLGKHVSIESVLSSELFDEFYNDRDCPLYVYLIATTEESKPHRFHRIEVKSSGYTYKEV